MARKKKTMDGNTAAAHVAYAFTEVAAIYPITPSSPMADCTDIWADMGRKNIFGQKVVLAQLQSEGGAAGAVHGALQAGALTTTYTASQGLLLMVPNMYKIAGELLPCVIHVAARTVASHALSIFGDHSDVYACRGTGFAFLCASNVQEVMDLGAVAHLAAIEGRVPFLHFFDGFRTSHEIQKVEYWDYGELGEMCDMDAVRAFRGRALDPSHPVQRGTAQNPDIFFQAREASNPYYVRVPDLVQKYMDMVNMRTGSNYRLFNYYGAADAEKIIIAMGSVCDTIEETIDYMAKRGEKAGLIKVRLYRPFSADHLVEQIPSTAKRIYVLDRTKEPGAQGEPLYLDIVSALKGTKFQDVPVFCGRYGLSSKDTIPADILAVFANESKERFTLGIQDDVTGLSLERKDNPSTAKEGTTSCKFWGMGADGTVGANKNSIKIIGDHTDKYVQAYFDYDSKKSGGVTISHLRFGDEPIRSPYLINKADFVACHMPAYIRKYEMVQDLKDGGAFLLNAPWNEEELENYLPGQVKRFIAEHHIHFYVIDGFGLGKKIGLGGRINTILQAAFFVIADIIPAEEAVRYMKEAAENTYRAKGDSVVKMNFDAIEAGIKGFREVLVPETWKYAKEEDLSPQAAGCAKKSNVSDGAVSGETDADQNVSARKKGLLAYVDRIQNAINSQKGNSLPVSAFLDYADGTMPCGSAAYEKRGVAVEVPLWNPDGCIQCNFCSYVCPHACIRPVAMTEAEASGAPVGQTKELRGAEPLRFAVSVSPEDCTGCGCCASVCPGNQAWERKYAAQGASQTGQDAGTRTAGGDVVPNKVLEMVPFQRGRHQQDLFSYGLELDHTEEILKKIPEQTVKGSQYKQPLLEFSGACGGCGETPYAKLLTQMFGDRMMIANATGCTSIWGGSSPASPYTVNRKGRGPAWANSLFEDNAEFGFGMFLAQKAAVQREPGTEKKSQWVFGGDGWAYDIGYGGLDHVLASGENINVLVFDTEVYSNTGGQASKATPTGAIAQFAAGGKSVKKKDLAAIAMSYGYIYVAQVAMGADMSQVIRAFSEAESYEGPSLVIAYSPCINHGIRGGMGNSMQEEKRAVESGYWHLFRYDPRREAEGENPLMMDSKEPREDFREFLMGEVRFNRLYRADPARAEELFGRAEMESRRKFRNLASASVTSVQ